MQWRSTRRGAGVPGCRIAHLREGWFSGDSNGSVLKLPLGLLNRVDPMRTPAVVSSAPLLCCAASLLQVTAAIVTCGGLCPGLNDVVQNIVFTLTDYGVPEDQILGIRYGLRGFYEREDKPVTLTRKAVEGIHLKGGTMLVSGQRHGQGSTAAQPPRPCFSSSCSGEKAGVTWWWSRARCRSAVFMAVLHPPSHLDHQHPTSSGWNQ